MGVETIKFKTFVLVSFLVLMASSAFAHGPWHQESGWKVRVDQMAVGTRAYEISIQWMGWMPLVIGSNGSEYSIFDGETPQKIQILDTQNIIKDGLMIFDIEPTKSKRINIPLVAKKRDRPCGIGGFIQTTGQRIPFSILWDTESNSRLFIGSNILDERF